MRKVRNIIVILLVAFTFWHFYGDALNQDGISGVYEEMRTDVDNIKDNLKVIESINFLHTEFQVLVGKLQEKEDREQVEQVIPETPQLEGPLEQLFSVHNIELGDDRSALEQQIGSPQRSTLNEYGVDWVAYHENYHNFFMVAYNDQAKVVGLYTNQDLLSSTEGITFASARTFVQSTLANPLESLQKESIHYQINDTEEYDMFLIDNNYVTIFYDKHQDYTVTAIQIISGELEEQREKYFTDPSSALVKGFEYQLFDLTNAARVKHNLPTLAWEEPVRMTARDHSSDMADNNYFGHTNLQGQSPFDRMTENAISYRTAGENLAYGQPSSVFAHEGLMNSLGHRENKLKSEFKMLAVGVSFNADSRPYYTENFLTK